MQCPVCGIESHPNAELCDCGFRFTGKKADNNSHWPLDNIDFERYLNPKPRPSLLWLPFAIVAVIVLARAFIRGLPTP